MEFTQAPIEASQQAIILFDLTEGDWERLGNEVMATKEKLVQQFVDALSRKRNLTFLHCPQEVMIFFNSRDVTSTKSMLT